jgi:hypothetical protein
MGTLDRMQSTTGETLVESNQLARKPKIRWPSSADQSCWNQLDDDLSGLLSSLPQMSVRKKLRMVVSICYTFCAERFGTEEQLQQVSMAPPTLSRRQWAIKQLRREKQQMKKSCKRAVTEEERHGLAQFMLVAKRQHRDVRRAESGTVVYSWNDGCTSRSGDPTTG